MSAFGSQAIKLVAVLPEKVGGLPGVSPSEFHIANRALIPMLRVEWDAVIVGTHQRVGADDYIRQIGRGLGPLAVNDEIFAASQSGWIVAIRMQSARVRVKRIGVVNLFVKGNARIGAEQHQGAPWRAVLAGHNILEFVTRRRGASIQQSLDVNPALAIVFKLEMVMETLISGDLAERSGNPGEDRQVVFGVIQRLEQLAVISRSWNSTQEFAGRPKSEYSTDAVIWVSMVTINSTLGLTFLIMP